MYDAGLYPLEAIRLLQDHWQTTRGKPCHKARMKDAGVKAALARKRREAARKAVATRRRNADRLKAVAASSADQPESSVRRPEKNSPEASLRA